MKKPYLKRHYRRDIALNKRQFMDNDSFVYSWKKLVHLNHVYGGLELRDLHKLKAIKVYQFIVPCMGVQIMRIK